MTTCSTTILRYLDREEIQVYWPLLSDWLLPGAFYGIQHTWPQIYRSDGSGTFYGLFEGERLVSHAAVRAVTIRGAVGSMHVALIGSVATAPSEQGRGFATHVLRQVTTDCRRGSFDLALLWAEKPELYARCGFRPGQKESVTLLSVPAGTAVDPAVRLSAITHHAELHALHCRKPTRVDRSPGEQSGMLTTPGMWTAVLEEDGQVLAYACSGKGADLQGWWHELGGEDEHLARLLPAAMGLVGQQDAAVIVPPYRTRLVELLGPVVKGSMTADGPMVLPLTDKGLQPFFVDGLDSV